MSKPRRHETIEQCVENVIRQMRRVYLSAGIEKSEEKMREAMEETLDVILVKLLASRITKALDIPTLDIDDLEE